MKHDKKSDDLFHKSNSAEIVIITRKISKIDALSAPATVKQAVNHKFAKNSKRAKQLEVELLTKLEVYKIIPSVPGKKVIKSKWVYIPKTLL